MSEAGSPTIHREQWETEDLRYICGLANAGGGTMIIAQSSKGGSGGFRRIKRPFEQIPHLAENELGLQCTTEPVLEGATLCLEITVPAASQPVAYNGTYWLYDGDRLVKKSLKELEEAKAEKESTSWEMRRQPQGKQKDLNSSGYLAVMSLDVDDGGSPSDSMEETLSRRLSHLSLKRQDEDMLTNAGVLILHNKPESLVPGASVRIALFDDEHGQLLRQSEVLGPLPHQLMEAMRLLYEEYLPAAISNDATKAFPPKEAVREALINALAHKNYEVSMPVRISVYPDKLTIQNPTAPSDEASGPSAFESSYAQSPNPVMANTLRLLGLMNGWGGSSNRMRRLCEENDQPAPLMHQNGSDTDVTFFFRLLHGSEAPGESPEKPIGLHARGPVPAANEAEGEEAEATDTGEAPDDAGEAHTDVEPDEDEGTATATVEESVTSHGMNMSGLSSSTPKNAPFNVRSVAAANRLDLTATDEYVLRVLHTNGRATAVRIANVLGVSESTVRRSFRKLKEHGLIERIGSDKAGYWRVLS